MTIPVLPSAHRRAEITQKIRTETGIDEAMIDRLITRFYARVRADGLLGPIFAARIADWTPHLERMRAFWSSVALMTGAYHGQPMQVHLPLPIDAQHFDHWLALFETMARETCPQPAADHFIERARRIAQSLELGIASTHGTPLRAGERYARRDRQREAASLEPVG